MSSLVQASQAVREGKQSMQELLREASAAKSRRDEAQKKYESSAAALQALQDEKGGGAAFDNYYKKYCYLFDLRIMRDSLIVQSSAALSRKGFGGGDSANGGA